MVTIVMQTPNWLLKEQHPIQEDFRVDFNHLGGQSTPQTVWLVVNNLGIKASCREREIRVITALRI